MKRIIQLFFLTAVIGGLFIQAVPNANSKAAIDTAKSTVKWVGKKIMYSHNGTVDVKSGSIITSKGRITGGEFILDMNTIKCVDIEDAGKNANLVGHLKNADFFDVANHPTAKLVVKKIGAIKDGVQPLTCDLTIKGITKSVSFPAKVSFTGKIVTATASFSIDRTLWDIRYGSDKFVDNLGDKAIKNDIDFEVTIVSK